MNLLPNPTPTESPGYNDAHSLAAAPRQASVADRFSQRDTNDGVQGVCIQLQLALKTGFAIPPSFPSWR
ncbi:hypothetical protein [Novipirellula caenicola]|uniref:hypothetical protein n=1 Tax=Novipirellula caenicola TaxID=1536901 RepID=UPI0031F15D85